VSPVILSLQIRASESSLIIATKALLEANDAKAGGRLLRWRLALAEFDFDVFHRSGVKNGNADALFRFHLMRSDPYGEEPTEVFPST
jgi:hypothetical protein